MALTQEHKQHRLEVSQLHVHYGSICALHNITFTTQCGKALGLIGSNGAGKSTLLKTLAGLLPYAADTLLWNGTNIHKSSSEIAYLPQREEIDWQFPITVRGLVEMGRYPALGLFRQFSDEDEKQVNHALDLMQLIDLQHRQISALSGGQQQRAFIARAIAQDAHVLLLDEPFAGLDVSSTRLLQALIRKLTEEHRLVIASHHDLSTIEETFDEVLLLKRNQVAFGTPQRVMTEENINTVFGDTHA